jgi:urease accessory protein
MRLALSFVLLILASSLASAHTGVGGTSSFMHGFGHPIGGLDHILAMGAAGIFAANVGGRAIWAVPLTFMTLMAVGGALGISGVALPFVEIGIALSILVLGLAVAIKWDWPVAAAMTLVGVFAIFHGHAHGTEMPVNSAGAAYAAGFLIATGLLHVVGVGMGLGGASAAARLGSGRGAMQLGGGAISVLGIGILTGVL